MKLLVLITDKNAENDVNDFLLSPSRTTSTFPGLTHASRMTHTQKRQLYLCSPKSCHPRVRRRELASPLRWRRSERLPCLSTITPKALRSRMHSARCPHPRSRPAGPCTSGRRRERGHRKEQRCVRVTPGRELQTPT